MGEYHELLKIFRNLSHHGQPDILPDWRGIESVLVDLDDLSDVEEELRVVLSFLIGVLGHEHPNVLAGRQMLDRVRAEFANPSR